MFTVYWSNLLEIAGCSDVTAVINLVIALVEDFEILLE
ncbi:hypothetical protein V9T40_003391 [Parthenolecanium corni]|uniref:Uncharacterized protein n=1 Tax=Parthenolecanium corni TaxID=536013 RepID=A0AAN9YA41_9HEMI